LSELDGDGLAASLIRNEACWHKTCRDRFHATKLHRAIKRFITKRKSKWLTVVHQMTFLLIQSPQNCNAWRVHHM